MSTSIFGGAVLYDVAQVAADRFCDTGVIRDGVLNNALHQADESAQHVVTWAAPAAALWTADSDPHLVSGWSAPGAWFALPLCGAYAARVRSDGRGYRLRITLGGRSSAGSAVSFAVIVVPRGQIAQRAEVGRDHGVLGDWPTKLYSSVTSTTIAMLTADDGHRYLDIPRRVIDVALDAPMPSTFVDTGGAAIGVRVPELEVLVFGKTAVSTSVPELHLLTAHEVIGNS